MDFGVFGKLRMFFIYIEMKEGRNGGKGIERCILIV